MVDGARCAFLGYVYQLLGTASIVVQAVQDVASGDRLSAELITRIASGGVVPEKYGQDALVYPSYSPTAGITAIQFKYSSDASAPIGLQEFIQILCAFDRSRVCAAKNGETIDRFVLIANRALARAPQQIIDDKESDKPHRHLTIRTKRGSQELSGNVKLLEPYEGKPEAAAAAWHKISRSLAVHTGISFESDLERLRDFGCQYGMLHHEWNDGVSSLIGSLVRDTAQGHAVNVTQRWLREHMIGDGNAANLRFGCGQEPHISSLCRQRLDDTISLHPIHVNLYLERGIEERLRSELNRHSVVFVSGRGGRGKSLAVARFLRCMAATCFVWSEGALTASEAQLVSSMTAVRLPENPYRRLDRCLRDVRDRLVVANGQLRPLLLLDLDGIDEAPDRISHLRAILNQCWSNGNISQSPASVIATCRSDTSSQNRDNLVCRWLNLPSAKHAADRVGFVELTDFVGEEIFDAARLLNGEPEQRILREGQSYLSSVGQQYLPVPAGVLRSLRHPVVWGEYAAMGEADRKRVLDRDPDCLRSLAKSLLARFLQRCWTRVNWRDQLGVEHALSQVARSTRAGRPPFGLVEWDQACGAAIDPVESRRLYNECLSYGVIEREAISTWRWEHEFLVDYLADLKGAFES